MNTEFLQFFPDLAPEFALTGEAGAVVKMRRGFKFRLRPTRRQRQKLAQFAGCDRFIYNKALEIVKEKREIDESFYFDYYEFQDSLPSWKKEFPWLKDCYSQVLQASLRDLQRAFDNLAAGRAAFPKFKKKFVNDSFRFPQFFEIDEANSRIKLPKAGWTKCRKSRDIKGKPKNVTVSRVAGEWYVSVQTEFEEVIPKRIASAVGIDMGVVRLATLSDGTFFEPIDALKKAQDRLALLQRKVSRKVKGSNNRRKAQAKVSKLHHKIAEIRNDRLHKITTYIANNHGIVCIEDLKIVNMTKSASGTVENPGKNVAAKSGLNRAILDQGWGKFKAQLEYKLAERGGTLVKVDPKNTSRTCPKCGHVSKDNRKSQAKFRCMRCGYEENADLVGAINVLVRAGHARFACTGDVVDCPQEPTEEILVSS